MAKGQSLWDRVWGKVDAPEDADEALVRCWNWRGALSLKRRGDRRPVIQLGKRGSKIVIVARLVCEWYHGEPPSPDHEAGHTCPDGENALCVNPYHLQWMTREENERSKPPHRRRNGSSRCITPENGYDASVPDETGREDVAGLDDCVSG